MEVRSVGTTSTARDDGSARCLIAIELSKTSWVVGVQPPSGGRPSEHRLPGGDWRGLLALIERIGRRLGRELNRPVEVISCYEAGYDGFWLHRLLEGHGVCNHVLDPASLLVNRRARRAKTDRIDVERMLRALSRHLRGEPDACSVVRVPSLEQEDARRRHRERHRLIQERVQHVNRIKALCALQGIYDYEPLRSGRRARLPGLRTGDGCALPARLSAEIARELQRLELVLEMIAQIEAERDAVVAQEAPQHPDADKIKALVRLKSIGMEFATTLVGEVLYRSFDNRRQLGSYVGLTPSPYSTGATVRDQGISKAGNPKARSSMVELAWMWLRHQPDSALSIWFRERVGALKGRPRRIAVVALARKLLVALWRYLETGLVPAGAVFKTR